MKNIILIISLFASTALAGNGVERYSVDFSKAGDMHYDVRERIEKILNERCRPAIASAANVFVKNVEVETDRIDQGIIDYTYKAHVLFAGWDQYENFGTAKIEIKRYDINNPSVDNIDLIKLESDGACH